MFIVKFEDNHFKYNVLYGNYEKYSRWTYVRLIIIMSDFIANDF